MKCAEFDLIKTKHHQKSIAREKVFSRGYKDCRKFFLIFLKGTDHHPAPIESEVAAPEVAALTSIQQVIRAY